MSDVFSGPRKVLKSSEHSKTVFQDILSNSGLEFFHGTWVLLVLHAGITTLRVDLKVILNAQDFPLILRWESHQRVTGLFITQGKIKQAQVE